MFESIALPANRRLREHFDGWAMLHMCGRSDHLLEVFRDGLRIDELQGFGWEVDLDRIAEVLGGRVVLLGNVNPMLIRSGSPDSVREATRRVIEKLAPLGGFIVQDGNNIPPGSPRGEHQRHDGGGGEVRPDSGAVRARFMNTMG